MNYVIVAIFLIFTLSNFVFLTQCAILKPKTPIMGLSTWNYFSSNINETLIKELAQSIKKNGLYSVGYNYINIDDGWGAYDREINTGKIIGHIIKFPSGMRALGDYLHNMGLKYGLYTSRWNRTCQGNMPGSLGHEMLDAETFLQDYEADWIKNDDCHVVYANAYKDYLAMQKAIASQKRYALHNVKAPDLPASEAAEVSQFRRVGKDLKNNWENLVRVLDTGMDLSFSSIAGVGFFNDFDSLEVGNTKTSYDNLGLTIDEQKAHFSLWAAMKSPLILGNDPRDMSDEILAILNNTEVISVNQDKLAVQAIRISSQPATSTSTITKVYLTSCIQPLPIQQTWKLQNTSKGLNIVSAKDNKCLEVWHSETRWPWWISVSPCQASTLERNPTDTIFMSKSSFTKGLPQQLWSWSSSGDIKSHVSTKKGKCWGSPGSGCCLMTEGSNVEIDTCGWPMDKKHELWTFEKGAIVSGMNGQCLTLAGDLEVYAGPLVKGCTVILFNRSPNTDTIVVYFKDLVPICSSSSFSHATVRDLWKHEDLGSYHDNFTALVPKHAVRHINIFIIS